MRKEEALKLEVQAVKSALYQSMPDSEKVNLSLQAGVSKIFLQASKRLACMLQDFLPPRDATKYPLNG